VTAAGPSTKGRATFDVEVAADTPLGLYGLRLATASGLSNAHLFLIDDLPITPEADPTVQPETAQPIALPAAVAGICREADVDRYALTVQAGQRVSFEVVGSRLGKDFDPLVTIRDARGRLVLQHDNDVGLFFDGRFEHVFVEAGTYVVEVRDARFKGSDHWTYVLRMGSFPVARVALPSAVRPGEQAALRFPQLGDQPVTFAAAQDLPPGPFTYSLRRHGDNASAWIPLLASELANIPEAEPNNTPEAATVVSVPALLHGSLSRPGDWDWFAFDLSKGQSLSLCAESRGLGSPADLELVLLDPTGKQLQRADGTGLSDVQVAFTAGAAGRYRLRVRDLTNAGGPAFVYRVEARVRGPRLELVSEVGRLAIPQGSRQPLPLRLTRTDYAGPVELALLEAPPGLALQTGQFPQGASQFVNALTVADAVPVGVYTVQVMARGAAGERPLTALVRTQPLLDRVPTGRGPHGEPFELREDQRRLPPTLTDRIAVVVTPAAPFTFELPAARVVLPRYLHTEFRLETTRAPGFDAPITFTVRGGQLEPDGMGRRPLLAEVPPATRDRLVVHGGLRSEILSQLAVQRVTVIATADHQGRTIALARTFDLDVRTAYEPAAEPARVELKPGGSARLTIRANRLEPFDGPVTVTPSWVAGLTLPQSVTVPAGQPDVEVALQAAADAKPGKYTVALPGSARVANFVEPAKGKALEVVIPAK
jgi:hypothetical protein